MTEQYPMSQGELDEHVRELFLHFKARGIKPEAACRVLLTAGGCLYAQMISAGKGHYQPEGFLRVAKDALDGFMGAPPGPLVRS